MNSNEVVQANYLAERVGAAPPSGPVTCLGMEFADDDARRAYFTERLREHLQDPAFRAIEGFPLGEDEAILALSDPPYYTACPNPFLQQIITEWSVGRSGTSPHQTTAEQQPVGRSGTSPYHREPFAADVSEGKNDPIYNAHSYHTKAPHKAIMRYILHYTEPGDIVFDGFCGSGMTGVAAQLCGDRKAVQELGYTVDEAGNIYDGGQRISRLGARKAVLNDLSPAATFIAYNYNTPVDSQAFQLAARRILDSAQSEVGWMYETQHLDESSGQIDYMVWSEVFSCPNCGREIVFIDEALDRDTKRVKESFPCPQCKSNLTKDSLERVYELRIDPAFGKPWQRVKYLPSIISYVIDGKRHTKIPDHKDLELLSGIDQKPLPIEVPLVRFPIERMYHGSRIEPKGFSHVHHFFFPRAAQSLAFLWRQANAQDNVRLRLALKFFVEQAITSLNIQNRYGPHRYSQSNGAMPLVYYVPSQISEVSPWYVLRGKLERLIKSWATMHTAVGASVIQTGTLAQQNLPAESVDYIFTDPPFGENIFYADLNFLVESWHKVITNADPEAIVDKFKHKGLAEYQYLMHLCFRQYFRVLKPGRWMTVEFHNSHDRVWRAIQEALISVGFVVADVRTLDKQQGSYRQVTSDAAKQDLIISAYKPTAEFDRTFALHAGSELAVWEFVRQHLTQLPIFVRKDNRLEVVAERQNYLLFDRMVAYHIQRGVAVPMGAAHFYAGLKQRFVERDGMYFLPDQVAEYDRARLEADEVEQISIFVNDEKSAITWLRVQLHDKPQEFADIQPRFLQELHQARHEEMPDLRVLLEQNFLHDELGRYYVPDPANADDLEKLRRKALLQEFAAYKQSRKKLKTFRTEAVRAGFAQAYQDNDFAAILQVASVLSEEVVQEDPDLLMYFDAASLRE